MATSISLVNGEAVDIDLDNFTGTGSELREKVARSLRISPRRLKLIASDEIRDEAVVGPMEGMITVVVGEGIELAEWCTEHLTSFCSVREVDGVGSSLDAGSEVISEPKHVGIMLMLAIQRVSTRAKKQFQNEYQNEDSGIDPEDSFDCDLCKRRLFGPAKEAAHAFKYMLDNRLSSLDKPRFYSRWEEHQKPNGEESQHRIYGIRQAYSAVEIDQVLGEWIEEKGSLDEMALISFATCWKRQVRSTHVSVERTCSVQVLVGRFARLDQLVTSVSEGHKDVAWAGPYMNSLFRSVLWGLESELHIFRDCCAMEDLRVSSARVIEVAAKVLAQTAKLLSRSDEVIEFLVTVSEERNECARLLGIDLLAKFGQGNDLAIQELRARCEYDWPRIRKAAAESLRLANSTDPITAKEIFQGSGSEQTSEGFLSPRSTVFDNLSTNKSMFRKGRNRWWRKNYLRHPLLFDYDDASEEE
eukprot:TRINITY_DN24627_c0_g1_i2.p1 TRINITY_DN24627_c0_g1~~TRINITY_DN24627_c0_g1_i2.p1  ORF type:complete len:511 (-),score=63.33 TRINITY_DN24627_c0_g1_i2:30-1445(-)